MANFVLFCDEFKCNNINIDKIYRITTYYNINSCDKDETRLTTAIWFENENVYEFDSYVDKTKVDNLKRYDYNCIPKNISFLLNNILSNNEKVVFFNDLVEEAILNCSNMIKNKKTKEKREKNEIRRVKNVSSASE